MSYVASSAYGIIELVGISDIGITQAIENGISKVAKTTDNISWFEVIQIGGHVSDGNVTHYQVTMKVGYGI